MTKKKKKETDTTVTSAMLAASCCRVFGHVGESVTCSLAHCFVVRWPDWSSILKEGKLKVKASLCLTN
jgi:hypothetical protein